MSAQVRAPRPINSQIGDELPGRPVCTTDTCGYPHTVESGPGEHQTRRSTAVDLCHQGRVPGRVSRKSTGPPLDHGVPRSDTHFSPAGQSDDRCEIRHRPVDQLVVLDVLEIGAVTTERHPHQHRVLGEMIPFARTEGESFCVHQ